MAGRRSPAGDGTDALRLPDAHRDAFKAPLGPVLTDPAAVLERVEGPLVAVGDIVAADLLEAGRAPDLAIVDGLTKRRPIGPDVEATLEGLDRAIRATNPPATITRSLVEAIATGLEREGPVKLVVDGEEDLAVIPAVLAAPAGATVVYGQPGEGVVVVEVDDRARARVEALLERLEGDASAVLAPLASD